MAKPRLLLADRVKSRHDSFLAPLMPELAMHYDLRFVALAPGPELATAIGWADLVWLEWCWDHAVWATQGNLLANKPCVVRLHSIEALQTDFPKQVDWQKVARLVVVAPDIADLVRGRFSTILGAVEIAIIPNGIDVHRFQPGQPERHRVAWVGHLEPKKNPMLMMQIAHRLRQRDPSYTIHVAGAATDLRTARYLRQMHADLDLGTVVHFHGHVAAMPEWYRDKSVLLSTSMYESFGLNIGEAMAAGAFPVIHAFPGADRLWPKECLYASIDDAVALIMSARPHLYRDWVGDTYGLDRQVQMTLRLLQELMESPSVNA
jgi:glycosyltransferase involved in cell wall biosynthesis